MTSFFMSLSSNLKIGLIKRDSCVFIRNLTFLMIQIKKKKNLFYLKRKTHIFLNFIAFVGSVFPYCQLVIDRESYFNLWWVKDLTGADTIKCKIFVSSFVPLNMKISYYETNNLNAWNLEIYCREKTKFCQKGIFAVS